MTTPTMLPAGWYTDPAGRHDYRYWDGTAWTAQVSDRGVTATDAPQLQPPTPAGPATARRPDGTLAATASARAYRAVAVPRPRVVAAWTALASVLTALLFEVVASVVLAVQVEGNSVLDVPSRSTFEWWSWLFAYDRLVPAYSYPPPGLWPALLLAVILLGLLPLQPLVALKKAGLRAPFRWSAPAERARLSRGLAELGYAGTLFRSRGRRGLLVFAALAAIAVIWMSAYAVITKEAMFQNTGTISTGGLDAVGLGPMVCLVAGVVALVAGLLAWPWTKEQPVLVQLDGTLRTEQVPGSGYAVPGPVYQGPGPAQPVTPPSQAVPIAPTTPVPRPRPAAAEVPPTPWPPPSPGAAAPTAPAPPGTPRP